MCNGAAKQVSAGTFPVLIFQRYLNQGHSAVNVHTWQSKYTRAHARRLRGHANRGEYRNVHFLTKPFFLPVFIIQQPNLKLPYLLISSAFSKFPVIKCAIIAAPFARAEKLVYIKKEIKTKVNTKCKKCKHNVALHFQTKALRRLSNRVDNNVISLHN